MLNKIDYSIKQWEKEKAILLKNIETNPNYIIQRLPMFIERLSNPQSDMIYKYGDLAFEYYYIGNQYYFLLEDIENFKGYYYLSAKAIEMCYKLYEKGVRSRFDKENSAIESNLSGRTQADCALLAGDIELALRLATKKSVIGNMILQNYEEARKYVEIENNSKNIQAMQLSIIEEDEKSLKKHLEERIKIVRREAKLGLTGIDRFGLTILKLAKMRGLSCDIHVAELPFALLEDTSIDYTKWQLPIPENVQTILEK